jgi:hypothetical protein
MMTTHILNKKENSINFLILLAFLTAPYFYIRYGGFDFSKGTSFSLVDLFLVAAFAFVAIFFIKNHVLLKVDRQCRDMLILGSIITFLCLLSGITAPLLYKISIRWSSLLSGTLQYAFIFIGFPLLAFFFLSVNKLRTAIRYIALGYLFPMLLTILMLPVNFSPHLRELFYFANRALGTYGNAVGFALVLVITFPFYVYLVATEKGFWQKVGYVGVIALLHCLFLTASFSGIFVFILVVFSNLLLMTVWKNNPLRQAIKETISRFVLILFLYAGSYVALSYYSPIMVEKVSDRIFSILQKSVSAPQAIVPAPSSAPQAQTPLPQEPTPAPQAQTPLPQEPTPAPQAQTPLPQEPTPAPQAQTPLPQEPTPAPQAQTPLPQEPTPAPQAQTPLPQEPTPAPQAQTPLPQEPTPAPQAQTPLPQEPTPAPQAQTPLPQEPTPAPQAQTPLPQESAPPPQAHTQASVMVQTASLRMDLNYKALKLIQERNGGVFFGHGLRQTSLMPEFNLEGNGLDVHLIYLLLWAEGGLILVLAFLGYFGLLFRNCINLSKTHSDEALAIGNSVLALVLFCFFHPHVYLRYFWVPLLLAFVTTKKPTSKIGSVT